MTDATRLMLLLGALLAARPASALDSYRFLHVTINTPWVIFILLFFLVFAPMILMVILYWRHALWNRDEDEDDDVL
ncbi:MAG: hypothetical protein D6682_06930 [Zetaproteobacteria bacterium]|nr:MAG: hypothetical protein D6682_06930 [Zetaproteobacteria bacterium]